MDMKRGTKARRHEGTKGEEAHSLRASVPSCLRALLVLGLFIPIGCSGPAPAPPPPHVGGLSDFVSGQQALQGGDQKKAQSLLEKAVADNPNLITAHQVLGDLYKKQNDYTAASQQYDVFARLDPYNYRSHYDLALMYQLLHRLREAIVAYEQALVLAPRDLNSNMNLGLVYLATGQTDQAIAKLQFAVSLDPQSAAAQCNLGIALETAGRLGDAEAAYSRAIELDPSMTVAMIDLGANLNRQGRGQEAEVLLRSALKRENSASLHEQLGDALVLQHRDDDAMPEYDAALKLNPNDWQAINEVGLIQLRKYQAGLTLDESLRLAAVASWQKSLSIHPDQPAIRGWVEQWSQNGKVLP
jgi:tetratricopeptide (TPR) repeat protein